MFKIFDSSQKPFAQKSPASYQPASQGFKSRQVTGTIEGRVGVRVGRNSCVRLKVEG